MALMAYRMKRNGPRMEPWGTAQEYGRSCKQWLMALTEKVQEDKYDCWKGQGFS